MNKERVKLLADALRSGKYDQGSGALKGKRGYCCLGVACDVYMKETGKGEWREGEYITYKQPFVASGGIRHFDFPPHEVVEWFGFERHNPVLIKKPPHGETAAEVNDNGVYSFNEIADLFEKAAQDDV